MKINKFKVVRQTDGISLASLVQKLCDEIDVEFTHVNWFTNRHADSLTKSDELPLCELLTLSEPSTDRCANSLCGMPVSQWRDRDARYFLSSGRRCPLSFYCWHGRSSS